MFDDAKFYDTLAKDKKSYGKPKCSDSAMFINISALDMEDDLPDAIENAESWLLDDSELLAA